MNVEETMFKTNTVNSDNKIVSMFSFYLRTYICEPPYQLKTKITVIKYVKYTSNKNVSLIKLNIRLNLLEK